MATLGVDCDILFIHSFVNIGAPCGFILDHTKANGPMISLQREAVLQTDGTYQDTFRFFFTVLIGDNLRQPDGNLSSMSGSDYYLNLLSYLQQHTNLSITTRMGVYPSLFTIEHYATETQLENNILVAVQLSSTDMSYFPADLGAYVLSLWQDDAYIGPMNYANSYWRS